MQHFTLLVLQLPIIISFKGSDYSFTAHLLSFHYEQVTMLGTLEDTEMSKMPFISVAITDTQFFQQLIMYCLVMSLTQPRKHSLNPAILFDFSLVNVFNH